MGLDEQQIRAAHDLANELLNVLPRQSNVANVAISMWALSILLGRVIGQASADDDHADVGVAVAAAAMLDSARETRAEMEGEGETRH